MKTRTQAHRALWEVEDMLAAQVYTSHDVLRWLLEWRSDLNNHLLYGEPLPGR